MKVIVNDAEVTIDDGIGIAALLDALGLPGQGVAVAVNQAVVPRSQWDRPVPAEARIEVVTAVQGG